MIYGVYAFITITLVYMCFHIEIHEWIRPNCPNCKDAKLWKNGKHHFPENPNIENIKPIYTCEKCKVAFIAL